MNNTHPKAKSVYRGDWPGPEPVYECRHPVAEFAIIAGKLALAIVALCAVTLALAYLLLC